MVASFKRGLLGSNSIRRDYLGSAGIRRGMSRNLSLLNGLQVSYSFDGGYTDNSGNGATLSPQNSPTFGTGIIGQALAVVRASQQGALLGNTSLIQILGSMTIGVWVNFNTATLKELIVGRGIVSGAASAFDWTLYLYSDNNLYLDISDGNNILEVGNSGGGIATGTWYCILAWYDAGSKTAKLSVNNGAAQTATWTSTPRTGTNNLDVGGYSSAAESLDGLIDNLNIWNRVLTASEQSTFYNNGLAKQWPF